MDMNASPLCIDGGSSDTASRQTFWPLAIATITGLTVTLYADVAAV